jgi:hypothetical protein
LPAPKDTSTCRWLSSRPVTVGTKRLFLLTLTLFTAGSVLCAGSS